MPANYSALLNVKSPEEYAAERQQLKAAELTNALNMQRVEAGKQEQNLLKAIQGARQRGASADELVGMGDYEGAKQRQAYDFGKADEGRKAEKWTQDKAKFVIGVQKDLAGKVMANPSGQAAMAAIAEMERISGQNMDGERQAIAMLRTPDEFRQWAAGHALKADEMLPKLDTLNTGGAVQDRMRDPITGAVTVTGSTKLGMAPGQAAQLGLQREQLEESKRHNRAAEGIQSSKAASEPKGGTPTEGERKAATLLARMQSSKAQLDQALSEDGSSARPGVMAETLRNIPLVGGDTAANLANSQTRQRVEAAQLDMLDAALTLGTGAAYTKEQLRGYARSYFPQIGDDAKTVADKQARLNNVIKAAEIAAGRAAPPQSGGATGSWGGWSIQEVK